MNKSSYQLFGNDVNTLVCESFSHAYFPLYRHILTNGSKTDSRLGLTYETLNFKTVILNPIKRCTISYRRNSNIYFHLAESLWVLAGRNDLAFIELFNSRFGQFSDDGITLHGAYGNRLRNWGPNDDGVNIDQFFTICQSLHENPDLRRSVVSLWNSTKDLGMPYKDIPCNTQLMFRIKEDNLYTTIINRSNDLHWGYVANIFQFSFLSEILALIIGKTFSKQTHFSQSLHFYLDNGLNDQLSNSKICNKFYQLYSPSKIEFQFQNKLNEFAKRFEEIDSIIKNIPKIILAFSNDKSSRIFDFLPKIEFIRNVSKSFYEITYLLILYVDYKKALKLSNDSEKIRKSFLEQLYNQKSDFIHQDFWAMGVNYFANRIINVSLKKDYGIFDINLGNY